MCGAVGTKVTDYCAAHDTQQKSDKILKKITNFCEKKYQKCKFHAFLFVFV